MRQMSGLMMLAFLLLPGFGHVVPRAAQQPDGGSITFHSSIDLVRVSAVVRDRKGRFVSDLKSLDFEILEDGRSRSIKDFRHDTGTVSIAMLFDVSGSMENSLARARDVATELLAHLNTDDETAVFTFDTRLDEVTPFTQALRTLPSRLTAIRPFGATSLHDAIARTAERVAQRDTLRRAVIVFTDGQDNWSHMTASEVSAIASSIDVPVYVIGIVPAIDNPLSDSSTTTFDQSVLTGSLGNLAYWTGGEVFVVSTAADQRLMSRQILEELRQQYLLAFEASSTPGWHPLLVRMRGKDLTVRARSGYIAGRSRPISQ
jgi:VWFA-related protein